MALYYRSRRRKFFWLVVFPSIILAFLCYIFFQLTHTFIILSQEEVYSVTFNIINNIIGNELEKIDTSNLVEYKFNNSGEIVAVNANVSTMNKLNNHISEELSKQLSQMESIYIKLPLGSFISSNFLSGIGPRFPVSVIPLNQVKTEYFTEFSSTGINQTRHRIFIIVTCDVGILSRLSDETLKIDIQIPIAETILVGNVPTTYININ